MLGLNNARINQLEAENRTLRVELNAANARANALRTALIAAWREHGIERTPGGQGDGGTVTAQGAMQRLCWN
jgi:hypothetical protein